jgi:hypothetical protein
VSGGTAHTEDHIVLDTGETPKWKAGLIFILSPNERIFQSYELDDVGFLCFVHNNNILSQQPGDTTKLLYTCMDSSIFGKTFGDSVYYAIVLEKNFPNALAKIPSGCHATTHLVG